MVGPTSKEITALLAKLVSYPDDFESITVDDARQIVVDVSWLFRLHLLAHGVDKDTVRHMMTKFRDAGRRSPPWMEGSAKGARKPQDGADGNRRSRWLFTPSHEYYASETVATLAEVKFYFQTLSMEGAPALPTDQLRYKFTRFLGNELTPGAFLDPIQKTPVSFAEFAKDARYIESGHLVPHGRKGRHEPGNATLMLKSSNRLQGDKTVDETMALLKRILESNGYEVKSRGATG